MIDMFYLRDNICHVLLVSTMIFFMMIIWLNKHMYDVMITLITLFLWIKLNVNLPRFLTFQKRDYRQFSSVGFAGLLKPTQFEGTH
jgi:hypothetical protein